MFQDMPMEGCTDGRFNEVQYFKCPLGRALFCPLRSLELDTRYMEPHQVPAARRQELKNCKYFLYEHICLIYVTVSNMDNNHIIK